MPTIRLAMTAQLRHGDLWKLSQTLGSQSAAAKKVGVTPTQFGQWLNMKRVPTRRQLNDPAFERLMYELTGKTLDELWPDAMRSRPWLRADKNATAYRDLDVRALMDYRTPTRFLPPDQRACQQEICDEVKKAIDQLKPRHRDLIRKRFGIDAKPESNQEIAQGLGVCKQRMFQIEYVALAKLRQALKHLEVYLPVKVHQQPTGEPDGRK